MLSHKKSCFFVFLNNAKRSWQIDINFIISKKYEKYRIDPKISIYFFSSLEIFLLETSWRSLEWTGLLGRRCRWIDFSRVARVWVVCSPVNEKGVQASGVGGQGLKPLPSQSYHQIAVGAYLGLSSSLSLSPNPPSCPPSRSLRSYSWFKFNCLLSAIPGVVDDGIAEIRESGVFPPPSSLSLSLSYLCFPRLQIHICFFLCEDAIEILSDKSRLTV